MAKWVRDDDEIRNLMLDEIALRLNPPLRHLVPPGRTEGATFDTPEFLATQRKRVYHDLTPVGNRPSRSNVRIRLRYAPPGPPGTTSGRRAADLPQAA